MNWNSIIGALRGQTRNSIVRGGVARIVTLPATVLASFATTALILRQLGPTTYGYVALVATLASLIPFADLGLGASIQSATAVAEDAGSDEHLERVLLASCRLLVASGGVLTILGLLVSVTVGWSGLLGVPQDGPINTNVVVPVVLVLFATSLPFGIGQRILIGLERNDLAISIAVLAPVIALATAFTLSHSGAAAGAYCVIQPAALLIAAIVALGAAGRLSGISLVRILEHSFRPGKYPGYPVAASAAPMFVIMVGLPLGLQSDRLILAHRASALELTQYAVAAQVYASVWSLIYSAGASLWPSFARRRARGQDLRKPWRNALCGFGTVGLIIATFMAVLLPSIVHVISGGRVAAPPLLVGALAAMLVVQALHLPSGMLLTRPAQLRFQALCVAGMLTLNVPLSWVLARTIGAAGPVVGSVIAIGVAQLLPTWLMASRVVAEAPRSFRGPLPAVKATHRG